MINHKQMRRNGDVVISKTGIHPDDMDKFNAAVKVLQDCAARQIDRSIWTFIDNVPAVITLNGVEFVPWPERQSGLIPLAIDMILNAAENGQNAK